MQKIWHGLGLFVCWHSLQLHPVAFFLTILTYTLVLIGGIYYLTKELNLEFDLELVLPLVIICEFCFALKVQLLKQLHSNTMPLILGGKGTKRKGSSHLSQAKKPSIQTKLRFTPSGPTKTTMTTKAHPYGISHSSALGSCDASSFISSSTLQLPDNKTANADLPRNPYDVGFYREKVRGMEIHEIEKLVKNVFVRDECYEFPKTVDANGRSRSFRHDWLKDYLWLSYSPSLNGAFCLPCVLFGDRFPSKNSRIKIFFSEPLTHWPDAKSAIKRHISTSSGLHVHTSALLKDILDQSSGKSQPINVMIDSNLKKKISENRKKLVPVVDTIILAGRLQLPLRGHRDDSQYHPEVGEYSEKHVGNFIELLNFRVRAGDTILESHLKHHDKMPPTSLKLLRMS
ncbi:uncharacterized protein LOC124434153 [Xenia sp. Carnegie-2017]|uniref:uncharacterized protein LOC124434153 n=1 Tax=Xenia sp. Carnegie-2017 TaxID=2897299 RepID=UPI001F04290D|nr:uncharacterized protein LOC124434153 [Xenia sp. Carnegie-2017]